MPTGFYPTNDNAANDGASPNDDDVSVNNSSTRRTKKRISSVDEQSPSSSSVVVTITKSHEDSADDHNNHSEEEEEEQLIIGTSVEPLLTTNNNNDAADADHNNSNDGSSSSSNNNEGAGRCWSCFIHLNNTTNNNDASNKTTNSRHPTTTTTTTTTLSFFTTHEHPLLSIPVCSICNDRAEAVESKVIDAQLTRANTDSSMGGDNNNNNNDDDGHEEEVEVNACSWCGLTDALENETSSYHSNNNHTSLSVQPIIGGVPNQTKGSTTYLDNIPLGDNGSNELLLCDTCPRGMCVKCCTVSLGGHVDALRVVRRACHGGGGGEGEEEEEEEWKCCYCQPTQFLMRLREEYRLVCCGDDDDDDGGELQKKKQKKKDDDEEESLMDGDGENNDANGKKEEEEDDDDDAKIARLIDELTAAEQKLDTAQEMLSKKEIEQTRHEIHAELLLNHESSSLGLEDLAELVENELGDYLQKWQRTFDLCSDAIVRLQEELEEGGVQLAQFYKFREEEEGYDDGEGSDYAREAEMELGKFRFRVGVLL